jgi:hypothetical protein
LERAADSWVRLASEQAAIAAVVTISCDSFTDPVVSVCLQQSLEHVFQWRPDGAPYIERFARIVSERTQCG